MSLNGQESLHGDNPHHESKSTVLEPHGPGSHQISGSAGGGSFEAWHGGVEDISIEGRTSEDNLLHSADHHSHRTPFIQQRGAVSSKQILVSKPSYYWSSEIFLRRGALSSLVHIEASASGHSRQ